MDAAAADKASALEEMTAQIARDHAVEIRTEVAQQQQAAHSLASREIASQQAEAAQQEIASATAQHASAITALADEHAAARAARAVELAQAKADADAAVATLRTEMDSQRTEHCEASEVQAQIGQIISLEKAAEVASFEQR